MTNRFAKFLMQGASPLMLLAIAQPAFAQSSGTEQVETVVVTGEKVSANGLMNNAPISKERSTITSEFLNSAIPAGQTPFAALNFMPGVNFTNNDPYGSSGGDIRIHGQDGNHISVTLDGMPLNDTGNYATYTNQIIDPEIIDRISVNQGSTDVDSPTAAATGGVVAIKSDMPHEEFGAEAVVSAGSYGDQRYLGRIDSGEIGPWGTRGFLTYSYQSNDKFKGPGYMRKVQVNGKIYQDLGAVGWITLAAHWNSNRNNAVYALDYAPNTTGFTAALANQTDLIHNPNGSGYIANPLPGAVPTNLGGTNTNFDTLGWDRDFRQTCPTTTPVSGVADNTQTTCSFWTRPRVNPSDTGNVRFQSLFNLTDALTLTADANFQYVEATGGSTFFTFKENAGQQIGSSVIAGPALTTTPYGCIAGRGCDLNGDGDVLDTVGLFQPSLTQTHRYGANVSLIYRLDENNTVQAAYTLDWGDHRQTGAAAFVDPVNGPYNAFGPVSGQSHAVLDATGVPLRFRDRLSYAIMNQAAFDYEGKFFDQSLRTSIGFRMPFLERDLNNHCYIQAGSSTAYCTTQVPSANNSDGTVSFAGSATHYSPPVSAVRTYNKFLPHLGVTWLPLGDEHQFFSSYTQEIAAPRTDNLYQSVCTATTPAGVCTSYSPFANTKPETSTSYQYGYRYMTSDLQLALIQWNTQVKNRIVSSFDQITNTYFDHNVPGINFWGTDLEGNYFLGDWGFYANASYTRARIISNIPVGGGAAPTLNKQLSETPKWSTAGRVTYKIDDEVNFGLGAKWVSRRYQTEDNNAFVPDYYTVNADVNWNLSRFGFPDSSLRLNVDNLFDKHYFSSVGTQTCWVPNGSFSGCTSYPTAYEGSPRTAQVTLTARY
ncbi:MAG: TonB-dependent receptor [Alphaproteobacteria bacterium]|nr:TonB-dependent receptor [Alphaproteobacteria bacterium]